MKRPSAWRVVVIALLIVVSVLAIVLTPDSNSTWQYVRNHLDEWRQTVESNLAVASTVFVIIYVLLLTPPVPMAAVVAIVAGALFGRWLGTGLLLVAGTTSATLAFLAARHLLHEWVKIRFAGAMRAIHMGVERDGGLYLMSLRLIPVIPFFLINMGMGLTPMRLRKFVLVSAPSMIPLHFLYANAGAAVRDLQSPKDVLSTEMLIALISLAVAPILLRRVIRMLATGKVRKLKVGQVTSDK